MAEAATVPAYRDLGLDDADFAAIVERLGRAPSATELAMFSVMWSEHCSYRSSRVHLRDLPSAGEHVVVGPGEGAGVVEVAPGVAVAWKIESHNHPSFVEPHNGAATGVGGIVRDVLSMGARPIALLDSLRFGPLDDARTRYLVDGVVGGISSYGNAIGVPTVGGELVFGAPYATNPLVNVACLGVVEDRLVRARTGEEGNVLVLFGSSTGRDGIGGASVLASAELGADAAGKRPSVQVGDPFTEKLVIEATLELVRRGLVAGLQDLGAGGLACPTSEMAARSGTGVDLDLDDVHVRAAGMEPFEVMISESQERMLAAVEPHRVGDVLEICARWGVEARAVGRVTAGGNVRASARGEVVADVPARALADDAPALRRAERAPEWLEAVRADAPRGAAPRDLLEAFRAVVGSPDGGSRRWVWEQYDHMMFLGTVVGPGGDAAVVRLPGRDVAVALSLDGPGRLCYLDPYEGARLAVAEAARNVACTGARPLAVTNCLNLGNPEKPEVMWQLHEIVRGVADACRALSTPVTGGNVSLYNETDGRSIWPTPVIGMLGVLDAAADAVGHAFRSEGDALLLLGATAPDDLGGSDYALLVEGRLGGRPPRLDLARERALLGVLHAAARRGLLRSAHDLSSGGLAQGLAEACAAGGLGCRVALPAGAPHLVLFSESPARALVTCDPADASALSALADRAGVAVTALGRVGGDTLDMGALRLPLEDLVHMLEAALPAHLSATVTA